MAAIRRIAGVVGAAALAATAVSTPALAGTTDIRDHNLTQFGTPSPENVKGNLIKNLVISGGGSTTCTASTLSGNVANSGSPLNITSASFSGCSGTASAISPQNLSWSGSVVYSPQPGGRDGVINITGFTVQATVRILVFTLNCTYGGTDVTVSAPVYNGWYYDPAPTVVPANPNRPVSANTEAQADLAGITVSRADGSSILCPETATITQGVYELVGESSPGSGTFNRTLNLGGTYP
jgi:hypothetical protein